MGFGKDRETGRGRRFLPDGSAARDSPAAGTGLQPRWRAARPLVSILDSAVRYGILTMYSEQINTGGAGTLLRVKLRAA